MIVCTGIIFNSIFKRRTTNITTRTMKTVSTTCIVNVDIVTIVSAVLVCNDMDSTTADGIPSRGGRGCRGRTPMIEISILRSSGMVVLIGMKRMAGSIIRSTVFLVVHRCRAKNTNSSSPGAARIMARRAGINNTIL